LKPSFSYQQAVQTSPPKTIRVWDDVTLAPFTTFGIGGPADLFAFAFTKQQLVDAILWGRENAIPTFLLGSGANILVGDRGFRGFVVCNRANAVSVTGCELTAESGATIAELIDLTTQYGLSGLEHYINIPSTVGGAMWQNLHFLSPDRSRTMFIEECVQSAELLCEGAVRTVDRDYFQFGYDYSVLHDTDDVVLEVTLTLEREDPSRMQAVAEANAAWRAERHPPGAERTSAGSIFQRITDIGAGRLIEAAGLKGVCIGGAEISHRHANYIVNIDRASAADVRALIDHASDRVYRDSGYRLVPEIRFIGEF
jgi:UDP-N-acetylmuramate dehydrogenase